MSQTIYKYPLNFDDNNRTDLEIPLGGRILTLQLQGDDDPTIWVLVDPERRKVTRRFAIYGTGEDIPKGGRDYIGTYQLRGHVLYGPLVIHVFEEFV